MWLHYTKHLDNFWETFSKCLKIYQTSSLTWIAWTLKHGFWALCLGSKRRYDPLITVQTVVESKKKIICQYIYWYISSEHNQCLPKNCAQCGLPNSFLFETKATCRAPEVGYVFYRDSVQMSILIGRKKGRRKKSRGGSRLGSPSNQPDLFCTCKEPVGSHKKYVNTRKKDSRVGSESGSSLCGPLYLGNPVNPLWDTTF